MVCRACGFNRRYCGEVCAALARAKSVRAAQLAYRHSVAGQEQHRDEERERRARRRQERVGDHILRPVARAGSVGGVQAPKAIVSAAAPPVPDSARRAPTPARAPASLRPVPPKLAHWRLVVGHGLAARAQELRQHRTPVRCACCGRWGRVVAVLIRAELGWAREPEQEGG